MCGIVCVAGAVDYKAEKVFKELLELDSVRGRHSTGVVKVNSAGEVDTIKKAIDGFDFVKMYDDRITQGINRLLLGHNRHATAGAVNDRNAHPFSHGDFHGVHNGTLTQQWRLLNHTNFKVDSENIYYDLSKTEDWAVTIKKLVGAYVLAAYDEVEGTLNIVRNEERPFAYCFSEDGKVMYGASEYMMLEWVLARNGIKHSAIQTVKPHVLYTFSVHAKDKDTISNSIRFQDVEPYKATVYPKPVGTPPAKKTTPAASGANENKTAASGANTSSATSGKDNKAPLHIVESTLTGNAGEDNSGDVGDDSDVVVCRDYYGLPMTVAEFKFTDAGKCGCAVCGGSIDPEEDFTWFNNDSAICEGCKDEFESAYLK